ncbi:hypothetical protein [Pedobacter nyackensis]|uniref:Uncharacterized protein n=1 Tax=Pedobacter nyackensis TaxID=475255 RepID=A0A1W2DL21_9SPHI|nr:hypothetical protein [Pedobacter nyackensis]SMC98139.1 hypothetical protein SAMN04488101_107144 [Pedobacter nyackensis]
MKNLFLAVALAMAAIGGAFAQYTHIQGGPSEFNCTLDVNPTCGGEYGYPHIFHANDIFPILEFEVYDRMYVQN